MGAVLNEGKYCVGAYQCEHKSQRIAELKAAVERHTDIYAAERQQADQARDERDVVVAQLAAERERAKKAEALLSELRHRGENCEYEEWQEMVTRIDAALSQTKMESEMPNLPSGYSEPPSFEDVLAERDKRIAELEAALARRDELLRRAKDSLAWFDHATNGMGCAVVHPLIGDLEAELAPKDEK